MAAVKNILKHVSAEVAGRRRKCYRKKAHVILKGDPCLVVGRRHHRGCRGLGRTHSEP